MFGLDEITDAIRDFLQQAQDGSLKTKGLYPKQIGEFSLRVSFGQIKPSAVPWIAILGEGQAVQKGIYPVFLYYKANDHLILAYGLSEKEKPELSWGNVLEGKQRIDVRMKELGFEATRYGESFVAAEYPIATQTVAEPGFSEKVEADLTAILKQYREVLAEKEGMPNQMSAENDLNLIFYGPPGTGKTYSTINHAISILDPECYIANSDTALESRKRLKARFDELVKEDRVRFVTFHQSFSYEDFVEGLRADSDAESGQIEYRVEPGVFKRLCDDARTHGMQSESGIRDNPNIWKISINGTGPSTTKSYCMEHGEARIGWGGTGDLRESLESNTYYENLGSGDQGTLSYFAEQIVVGDILLSIHSADQIGSIGVVTGDYRYDENIPAGVLNSYKHIRPVRWLYKDINLSILPINDNVQFTLKTVYAIKRFSWADLLSYLEQQGVHPVDSVSTVPAKWKPYVLIIDEINRGNISRIFGELITLIEPSKREGANEAITVKLPYSKKPFSVPKNVYLLGTMNTADRSLAGLDIALRRRFTFREMSPQPELFDSIQVEGVAIGELMRVMNQRIEVLLGRDYCLGHAYFVPLKNEPTVECLALIFRNQILPLLQEYFFEDWQRIQWVLNDHRKVESDRFILQRSIAVETLFGPDVNVGNNGKTWNINEDAFERLEAYLGVIDPQKLTVSITSVKREVTYGELTIRELATGSIEVLKHGVPIAEGTIMTELRTIADSRGVYSLNSSGNPLNTRTLGRKLIKHIQAFGV